MYIEVLQNNIGFFDRGVLRNPREGEYITLIEYLNCPDAAIYGYTFAVTQFAFLGIESNDVPSVILETSPPFPGMRLILHYHDGKVYGYSEGFRGMRGIYTDGTFCWSGGMFSVGTVKLRFSLGSIEYVDICERSNILRDDGTWEYIYFIHGEQVPEDVWDACYYGKEDATWYSFDSETIAEDLNYIGGFMYAKNRVYQQSGDGNR
jgi:hypothetical protein